MKIRVLIAVLLCNVSVLSGQKKKLEFESLSVTLGSYDPENGTYKNSFIYTDFFLATKYKKNLFAISLDGTFNWFLSIVNVSYKRSNISANLLYGRSIKIDKWFRLEAYSGVGLFKETYRTNPPESTWNKDFPFLENKPDDSIKELSLNTISIPIKIRLLVDYSKNYSAGINYSLQLNKVDTYQSIGLIYQYRF